jgi:hypothetical protein
VETPTQEPEEQPASDQVEGDDRGEAIEGGSSSAGEPTGPSAADVPPEAEAQGDAESEEQ